MLNKLILPTKANALPDRDHSISTVEKHYVTGAPLKPVYENDYDTALFGMGCFWGAEKKFWSLSGVVITSVGYAGGITKNPTYEEVCSGATGHTEVVQLVYDSSKVKFETLLKVFWENHDSTQGMRQGNDVGTQYRSAIYVFSDGQFAVAEKSRAIYQQALWQQGLSGITTEIKQDQPYYFAEEYHQQYLAKNPAGYCNHLSCDKTGYPQYPAAAL